MPRRTPICPVERKFDEAGVKAEARLWPGGLWYDAHLTSTSNEAYVWRNIHRNFTGAAILIHVVFIGLV
jgi:hypothetical protein